MFRTKRTCCVALAVLGVLLLPLPAMAGGFGEPASTALSWDGVWADLLAWLRLGPTEADSPFIDPNGGPDSSSYIDPLGGETAEDSSYIDPNGGGPNSSSYIDPDGKP